MDPLEYDSGAGQLSARVPLTDRALIEKLTQIYDLNPAEQGAVQDLFFQPRAMLAAFALLFDDFEVAQRRLIEEADEAERFGYFRHQFLLCRHRCHLIAQHLTRHVAAATGQDAPDDGAAAALILRTLAADENKATASWEDDSGAPPALTWTAARGQRPRRAPRPGRHGPRRRIPARGRGDRLARRVRAAGRLRSTSVTGITARYRRYCQASAPR